MFSGCMWKKDLIDSLLKTGLNGDALGGASCLEGEKKEASVELERCFPGK